MTISLNLGRLFNDASHEALIDELKKRNSEESILEFEEKPLYVQFLPFSNMMNERAQLQNALAFTFIMGFSIF